MSSLTACRRIGSAWLILLSVACTPAAGQPRASGFGPAILPESPQVRREHVDLIRTPPPRNLAEGAEVVVVSGYQPDRAAAKRVKVVIDRPGRKVFAMLAMTEETLWELDYTAGTVLQGVVVSWGQEGRLRMTRPAPAYATRIHFAYEMGGANYVRMQDELHRLFGITRIDVLRTAHTQAAALEIRQLDPPRPEYVYALPKAEPPPRVVEFELMADTHVPVRWRLDGPVGPGRARYLADRKIAVGAGGATTYTLKAHEGIDAKDLKSGISTLHSVRFTFPRLSWGEGIAYDSKRDIVSIVSLGGEGFFYRFDAVKGRWIDYHSMGNIDASSLAYDPKGDRYVAWAGQQVLYISAEGVPGKPFDIRQKLPGLLHVTRAHSELVLVPRGDDLVVAAISAGSVRAIWHYDVKPGTGTLTYLAVADAK